MENTLDKVGYVEESCTTNGGVRSVIHGVFTPGAMAPNHYHTEFNESFEIIEGELAVWDTGKKTVLKAGERTTINLGNLHKFKNESDKAVTLLITVEPGYVTFEHNINIMRGLQDEGMLEQLSKMTPKMVPVGMIMTELSNTKLVGMTGVMFKVISLFYSKKKIKARKEELLFKYCPNYRRIETTANKK